MLILEQPEMDTAVLDVLHCPLVQAKTLTIRLDQASGLLRPMSPCFGKCLHGVV